MPSMAGDDMVLGAVDRKDTSSLKIPEDFSVTQPASNFNLAGSVANSSIPGWLIGDI